MEIKQLLFQCGKMRASDLHLSPGLPPIVRVNGDLQRLPHPAPSAAQLEQTLLALMDSVARQDFAQQRCCDFRLQTETSDSCRVHVYVQSLGCAAAIRFIPAQPKSMTELGLPPILQHIVNCPRGLVLVTGPSGSGKSTTLAAMLRFRAEHRPGHIVTLEDPIEYVHQSQHSLVTQFQECSTSSDYSVKLRQLLRQDPDVIMLGEMRDAATIKLALEAAETGHLVLSTLHTRSARNAVARIVSGMAPHAQEGILAQLALSLTAIVAQILVKSADGARRIAAHEILLATHAVRHLIRDNRMAQLESLLQSSQHLGMQTLEQDLTRLVNSGQITALEAKGQNELYWIA